MPHILFSSWFLTSSFLPLCRKFFLVHASCTCTSSPPPSSSPLLLTALWPWIHVYLRNKPSNPHINWRRQTRQEPQEPQSKGEMCTSRRWHSTVSEADHLFLFQSHSPEASKVEDFWSFGYPGYPHRLEVEFSSFLWIDLSTCALWAGFKSLDSSTRFIGHLLEPKGYILTYRHVERLRASRMWRSNWHNTSRDLSHVMSSASHAISRLCSETFVYTATTLTKTFTFHALVSSEFFFQIDAQTSTRSMAIFELTHVTLAFTSLASASICHSYIGNARHLHTWASRASQRLPFCPSTSVLAILFGEVLWQTPRRFSLWKSAPRMHWLLGTDRLASHHPLGKFGLGEGD